MKDLYGFRIVEDLQKIDTDIRKDQLKYHSKRVLVSKSFTFDAAHHLHAYEGKCMNLHGHTYQVIFGISGYTDDCGLVVDFADIKKLWKEKIETYLDHKYINETLPPMNTTAENIVVWIYERMQESITDHPQQLRVEYVKLFETPTSFAEARREWMEDE